MIQAAPSHDRSREYYEALVDRRAEYEGTFFVGVRTTGVFCRPTCPARKPKFESCEFFATAEEALLASYRPCKRCRPLSLPQAEPDVVGRLVDAVEADVAKRWTESDFRALGLHSSTARRQFQRRFGMSFVAYARNRRMGLAMKGLRDGRPVIDAQLEAGYESASGFREAYARIMGVAPANADERAALLRAAWLDTPLGPTVAIADEHVLHLLEFTGRRGLEREIERLRAATRSAIVPGRSEPIRQVEDELGRYFEGRLRTFETPIASAGSAFQRRVRTLLHEVPFGETRTYAELATMAGRPQGARAVGRACGANPLAIVVPCHRILRSDGALGGYGGGLPRKEWLLRHERRVAAG